MSAREDRAALGAYLQMLAGQRPAGRFIELRYLDSDNPSGMSRRFFPAWDLAGTANAIIDLATWTDVYSGVLLRDRRAGGNDAVSTSHLLWAELDTPDALERLDTFPLIPSMIIASGTAGHAHAYWQLRTPIAARDVAAHNRSVARALGADLASVDPARILRPPASLNYKHTPPAAVDLLDSHTRRRYRLQELLDCLPEDAETPEPSRPSPTAPTSREGDDRRLLEIPAAEYVSALAGLTPNRAGKIACPFHQDHTPSLQLYEDASWYCFGACHAGGSLYDFASRLWGLDTKGRDFIELRDRLIAELLGIDSDV
jgi:hypothetical protein